MKLTRTLALALALPLAAAAAGCRTNHLGPSTGDVYRAAVDAQRQSEADEIAPLDANDAKSILAVHEKTSKADKPGTTTSSTTTTSSGGSASSTGGAWPGATGNISLDAK